MSQWYYAKNNQQQGPVSEEQLKQLVASGELQPSDLVWTEGMSQWAEARGMEWLFPAPTVPPPLSPMLSTTSSQLPPPVPSTITPPPSPRIAVLPTLSNSPASSEAPALWNPNGFGAWGLLFSWAFGAFLLARNWEALGEPAKAKRAMIWFYAVFPFLLVVAFVPQIPKFTGLAILVVFFFLEAKPQANLLKKQFNDEYPRKSWWKPIGIAVGCVVAYVVIVLISVASASTTFDTPPESQSTIERKELQKTPPVQYERKRSDNLGVSLAGYNAIKTGMTEREVESLLGCEGNELSSSDSVKSVAYTAPSGAEFISIVYLNGRVSGKGKVGL